MTLIIGDLRSGIRDLLCCVSSLDIFRELDNLFEIAIEFWLKGISEIIRCHIERF